MYYGDPYVVSFGELLGRRIDISLAHYWMRVDELEGECIILGRY